MRSRTALTFLSSLAWAALTNANPADPTITPAAILPRQNAANFIGWIEFEGEWSPATCDGANAVWKENGELWVCCDDSDGCTGPGPVGCAAGALVFPDTSSYFTSPCSGPESDYTICNTQYVFENMNDNRPRRGFGCGASSVNWSYYRNVPATISAAASGSNITSTAATTATTSDPNKDNQKTDDDKKEASSNVVVIGAAVGGGVGALLIIAAIAFFLLRRRKNKNKGMLAPPQYGDFSNAGYEEVKYASYGHPSPGGSYHQGYSPLPVSPEPQYSELHGASHAGAPVELSNTVTTQHAPAELPSAPVPAAREA